MENFDYDTFARSCMDELKILQKKLQEEYDLNSWERWFYNQSTGLLTFSTGDEEINFKYLNVGSFSAKSKTWKWSWDNETTSEKVKNQIDVVKEYGLQNNFTKLTTGYFDSDEYDAWEFAAVANKLAKGLGVYRPVNEDQLQLYFVLMEYIDLEQATAIKDKFIECDKHDTQRVAFICNHLLNNTKPGFHEAFETFEDMELLPDDDFQAWCNECEAVREQEGEWNDKSMAFADIKLICERCYFEMKENNLGRK